MQANQNRSFSNPPLRELNSISLTQKINSSIISPSELSKISKTRPFNDCDTSYEYTEKKLGGIEGDRAVLINRINKLQQEVDNLNKENSELHSKVNQEKARYEDFKKKFSHTSKVKTLVDRNYQGDLKYEREENLRLKHVLSTLEKEKNELKAKVKEFDSLFLSSNHEKQEISRKLQQKIDHVSIIEGDNRILVDKISLMSNKIQIYEREHFTIINENENYKSLLSNLESQNSDILIRLQEEASKYNNFVNAKNNELENLKWAFRRQLKIVSSNSLGIELKKIIQNRLLTAFNELKIRIAKNQKKLWGAKIILADFMNYNNRRLKHAFNIMSADMS